jgi:uncharacterized protein (TIGR03118 family)
LAEEEVSATMASKISSLQSAFFRFMKTIRITHPFRFCRAALVVSGLQFLLLVPWSSAQAKEHLNTFAWFNLQSDVAGVADRTDGNLVNAWGLALNTNANVFWVADNGSGLSTLYQPDGTLVPLVVTIPPTSADTGTPPQAAPTGIVFSTFPNVFLLSDGQPAAFIFDGEDGSITAWNRGLKPITSAVIKVDNSSPDPAKSSVYKGLALAVRPNGGGPTLYATNFHNGTIDVFDSNFQPATITGNFVDPTPPPVPAGATGWGPFGIANIDNLLYVTFAAQNDEKHDDVAALGNGFVDVFDTEGHLLKRLITGGQLDSPWGLARVPDHFGRFDHEVLLVGNFGNGQINAYDIRTGTFHSTLLHRKDQPLAFNGLWSLSFFKDRLYFTAGIVDEAHGLFGVIERSDKEDFDQ